jgi:hypothetical protein
MSANQPPATPVKLSDADRKRLLRKDALNTAEELANSLASRLKIWSTVLLYCARYQVKEDIVGAMAATAQQQTHTQSTSATNASTTPITQTEQEKIDSASMPPPPPSEPVKEIKIKQEPAEIDELDFLFQDQPIKQEKDDDDMLADMY